MKISFVVPVFKGEKTLENLINKINLVYSPLIEWEAVLVYDCGPDNSWDIICRLKEKYSDKLKGIKLKKNFGQHISTIIGLNYSQGDIAITLDEDLQYRPEDVVSMVEKIEITKAKIIYGIPQINFHSKIKRIGSTLLKVILRVNNPEFSYDYSSLRILSRQLIDEMLESDYPYFFIDGALKKIKPEISTLAINHYPRKSEGSSYTFLKLARHAIAIVFIYTKFITNTVIVSGLLIGIFIILKMDDLILIKVTEYLLYILTGILFLIVFLSFLLKSYKSKTFKWLKINLNRFIEEII